MFAPGYPGLTRPYLLAAWSVPKNYHMKGRSFVAYQSKIKLMDSFDLPAGHRFLIMRFPLKFWCKKKMYFGMSAIYLKPLKTIIGIAFYFKTFFLCSPASFSYAGNNCASSLKTCVILAASMMDSKARHCEFFTVPYMIKSELFRSEISWHITFPIIFFIGKN